MKGIQFVIITTFTFVISLDIISSKNILALQPQKKEEPILLSSLSEYSNPLDKVRKNIIDVALKHLPKREILDELKMILAMKKAKENYSFNEAESAYFVFKWIKQNIEFDCNFPSEEVNNDNDVNAYNKGEGSYYEISKLFMKMCEMLGLEVEYIKGYTFTILYFNNLRLGDKVNYVWNSVKIDNNYYLIDAVKREYCLTNDFIFNEDKYFCPPPEAFIRLYFPQDSKWQLLPEAIDLDQFLSFATLFSGFFKLGFTSISPDKALLNITKTFKVTLTNENPNIFIYCNSFDSFDNRQFLVSNIKGRIEIDFIINKIGISLIRISARNISSTSLEDIAEFMINNEEKNDSPLLFPYKLFPIGKGLKLIEPLYCPLKIGETIKFQIICEFSKELIVIDRYKNFTLTKEGDIFSGKYFVNSTRIEIQYLHENGRYRSLFRYSAQ